ncbi:predicted protein [Postia placenta Mad-698-R]|nr:predicted protein [Postia placenta Mad-698-R]
MSTEDFYVEASEETLQLNYCALASVVLVFYEHSLTLADEMQLVWASKVTGPKVLFVAARYTLWVICLVQIWLILPQSNPTNCQVENILSMITDLSQYVVMLVFSALRAYAISGQHKAPAIIIAILLTFSVSINLYQYSTSVYATVLNVGIESVCNWGFTVLPNIGLIIPNIVICCFLLNLRQLDGASGMSTATQDHELSTSDYHDSNGSNSVRFASRIVGNMGEDLHDDDAFNASEHDEELSTGVEQEVLEPGE